MNRLDNLISVIDDETVYIQTHNYPDQDALASAFGLQYLLKKKGINAVICYEGRIDKLNTVSMVSLLNIKPVHIKEATDMGEDSQIIIVDGQKGNDNMEVFIGNEIACIDHHRKEDTSMYKFYDIRSDAGACASIIASYFVENNIEIPVDVATALLYGIKVDTNNLSRAVSRLDIDMFYKLFIIADIDKIRKFESSSLKIEDLKAYASAINNLKVKGKLGVVNIGDNCSEAILGTMSDFIMLLHEITFSLVYSRRAGGIKFSVRNEDPRLDAAHVIRRALDGYGSGGGHSLMAAGFVPNVQTDKEAKKIVKIVEQRIRERMERVEQSEG